jgi:peptide alpha-N-acetyltransferase
MLAIETEYRGHGLGTQLVQKAIQGLQDADADEVVLETEEDNIASLRLYGKLNFLRTKHLHRYYLNGKGAFRLVLPLKNQAEIQARDSVDDDFYG